LAKLRGLDGVLDVHDNELTGSLLVQYDPAHVSVEAIVAVAADALDLPLGTGTASPGEEDRFAYVAIDAVRELNRLAQELTQHRTDLRVLVPALLGGLSVWSAAAGGLRLPPWETLLYWSYSVFLAVNQREIEDRVHAPVPS
jgi:hypothetical protein